ncbi:putative membrane protein [Liberibacter crescens BT-1]|uniref:Putative membrane protein n=1 Tax=Liberibacter crescens (strain BT-1) TaxID=1215343 RepID=L0EV17_LIBCB|nr:LptF/LptG family permease [Liberibacter crescens]AGA64236.1 putative membrane protein [Liberibacter crescens BT-1]
MKLLELYILRHVCRNFLLSFMIGLAIIWITQVLQRINLVTDNGQSIIAFMQLAAMILPTIIPVIIPFSLVIAVTQTLTTLNNDSELTIIDSIGASRVILIRPVMIVAIALSIFSFIIKNTIEPKLRIATKKTIATVYADLLPSILEEKTFNRISDGLYIQISERTPNHILKSLFVADSRNPSTHFLYYARKGYVDVNGTSLIMQDGEVHQKNMKTNAVSIIRFDSYTLNLSYLMKTRGQITLRAMDRDLAFLLNPDPNDPDYQSRKGEYSAEMNKRLVEWMLTIVFALIALVAAGDVRSHRIQKIHPVIVSLIIAFGVYWIFFYIVNGIEKHLIFIPFLYSFFPFSSGIMIFILLRKHRKLLAK